MNLPPKVVRQIERGEKTQHRVPINTARKTAVGESLVVQHAHEHEDEAKRRPQVRVIVTDLATAPVGDTTTAGAQAEGHPSLAAFASDWMRRHDPSWPPQTEALCKECDGHKHYENHAGETVECDHCDEVGTVEIPDPDALADTALILARFERKHAHHLVHVITFELQVDVTRFLNRWQYMPPTTSIGEALDPTAPILDPPRPDWKHRADVRRREALRDRDGARLAGLRSEEERLAELKAMAQEANVDISTDVKVIRHRLNAIETKITNKTQRAA